MEYSIVNALQSFGLYIGMSIGFLVAFKFIYALATPHKEWALIKNEKNVAAAVGFGGAIVGFSLALASAASNSVSIVDYAIWGAVALLAQLLAFALVRFIFMPKIVSRLENNEVSAGVILAATNIAVGLLNAACMTY
jgi:putative membrane protein